MQLGCFVEVEDLRQVLPLFLLGHELCKKHAATVLIQLSVCCSLLTREKKITVGFQNHVTEKMDLFLNLSPLMFS